MSAPLIFGSISVIIILSAFFLPRPKSNTDNSFLPFFAVLAWALLLFVSLGLCAQASITKRAQEFVSDLRLQPGDLIAIHDTKHPDGIRWAMLNGNKEWGSAPTVTTSGSSNRTATYQGLSADKNAIDVIRTTDAKYAEAKVSFLRQVGN